MSLRVLRNFWKSLVAVLAGNALYFLLMPQLPPAARHAPGRLDLGLAVDLWFCLVAYGLIELFRRRRSRKMDGPGRRL
ncbi:MAG TPA: hypothetical protein VMS96_07755 [Terriglobales bacterium]|nr:hypothetical protein [Terriglobales bacterium]